MAPQLPKARISGATRWLRQDCALVQMSLRYKTDDHFWFTFFHEAAHILLHGKRDVFLEDGDNEGSAKEVQANQWASEFLIPGHRLNEFMADGERSRESIVSFAHELGIAPGIVVGQLQHRGYLEFTALHDLKRRLAWVASSKD